DIPEPGDYESITVIGEPLIIVRRQDGSVGAMSAVCRHRGMCLTMPGERPIEEAFDPIPEQKSWTRAFKCPYHAWAYDLHGNLLSAPEMKQTEGFDRTEIQLPQIRTEIWEGF